MLPIIVIIGQKNVGKSTLFNRLTCTHNALTSDYPGLTQDFQCGYLRYGLCESILVDTGGISKINFVSKGVKKKKHVICRLLSIVKEASLVLFVIDSKTGESIINYDIIHFLRKLEKIVFIVVNKVDNIVLYHNNTTKDSIFIAEYYAFGIEDIFLVSAIHGYGVDHLLQQSFLQISNKDTFDCKNSVYISNTEVEFVKNRALRLFISSSLSINLLTIAVVGRPNSGKSTLINKILKKDRMIVSNMPGTTRDSIFVPGVYNKKKYVFVDTAGIQKNKKFYDVISELAITRTLQVVKDVHVILFIIDSNMGFVDEDLSLLQFFMQKSRSLIIVFNKWDNLSYVARKKIKNTLLYKKNFIDFFHIHFISALHGNGIEDLFRSIEEIHYRLIKMYDINTAYLTRMMHMAVVKYPPPFYCGRKITLKYVHVGGLFPFVLVFHGSNVSKIPKFYQKYLNTFFHKILNIDSIVLHMRFKDSSLNKRNN